jgi:Stage II sporulation protein E (SpoIIE)/PAS fold
MTEPEVDYAAVFRALPGAVALLTPQLFYVDADAEFLRIRGGTREQMVGRFAPDDRHGNAPAAPLLLKVEASLRRVADTGERDTMALQRYDMDPDQPGVRHERYFNVTTIPVFGPDRRVALLLHRVEDVTELIRAREVALTLQEAMLPAPSPVGRTLPARRGSTERGRRLVRPDRPARRPHRRGRGRRRRPRPVRGRRHGTTAQRPQRRRPRRRRPPAPWKPSGCTPAPSKALRTPPWPRHSSTGTPTPSPTAALATPHRHSCRGTGTVEFLDQATDPPLGARPEHALRIQAAAAFREGAVLVLYTDGLIERRREDIDTGLARLADSLARHQTDDPETLADAVLTDLLPPGDATDDTALIIVRL